MFALYFILWYCVLTWQLCAILVCTVVKYWESVKCRLHLGIRDAEETFGTNNTMQYNAMREQCNTAKHPYTHHQ